MKAFKIKTIVSVVASATMFTSTVMAQESPKHDSSKKDDSLEVVSVVGYDNADKKIDISTPEDALLTKKNAIGINAIMSEETINSTPGGNITDILSSLPGVSGFSDMGKGQAATGESEFVSIRGIDSSYNSYLMNGMRMPQADSGTRAISMKMLAPYGLQSARVIKTPTAVDPGDAIGGIVDILTPTGFDRGRDFVRLHAGGNFSQKANDKGFDATGGVGQLELATIFGDHDQFGIYATAFDETRYSAAESLEVGGYTNSKADGSGDHLLANDLRMDFYHSEIKRYGGNVSLDWKLSKGSMYTRASYGHYESTGSDSQRKLYIASAEADADGNIQPTSAGANGYFQLRDDEALLANVQFGGDWKFTDKLSADYNLSYGHSESNQPNYIEGSLYSPKYKGALGINNISDPKHINFSYSSDELRNNLNNPNAPKFRKTQGGDAASENDMYNIKLDMAYKPAGFLDKIKSGLDFSVSKRDQYNRPMFHGNDNYTIPQANGKPGGSSNPQGPYSTQIAGQNISFNDGLFNGFRVYDRAFFENFTLPAAFKDQYSKDANGNYILDDKGNKIPNPGAYTLKDRNEKTVSGKETITSLYTQAEKETSNGFGIIAGLRYERTDYEATSWLIDGDNSRFDKKSSNYGDLLPNLNISYRPNDQFVYRFAARRSIARPAFALLAGPTKYTRNDNTDKIETIQSSNPNLNPVSAYNFDASMEFYPSKSSVFEVAVYSKKFNNYIYTAATTGATPPATDSETVADTVTFIKPENGGNADLRGVEVHTRYQVPLSENILGGFGFDATATMQTSSATTKGGRTTELPRTPEDMYSLRLFYDNKKLLTSLNWQYTGLQLLSLDSKHVEFDKYLQPRSQLDFNTTYRLKNWSITGQITNLLDEPVFYKTLGKSTKYLGTQDGGGNGSYVEVGRTFKLIASYKF